MDDKTLNGFKVGDTKEIRHLITQEDIEVFTKLTGDDNPIHIDEEYAQNTRLKGRIAHGMLGASFISTVIGKHIPGEGALWVSQSMKFLLPVRAGDEIVIRAMVTDIFIKQRVMELEIIIQNQYNQTVLTGESQVKVLEQEKPADTSKQAAQKAGVVIVTGGSRGIGAAVCKALGKEGYTVVVNYKKDTVAAESVVTEIKKEGGKAISYGADITDYEQVKRMVGSLLERYSGIYGLVNNASSKFMYKKFMDITEEEMEDHLAINFKAPLNLIKQLLPVFQEKKEGSVVNIASIATDNVPTAGLLSYISAKSALISATKSLAVEYGADHIRFNIVSPGMTNTRLIADMPEKGRLLCEMEAPLRSIAQPEDIADSVVFLLSDKAKHITGETLRVCGGVIML